jgi:ribosome-binding factor A
MNRRKRSANAVDPDDDVYFRRDARPRDARKDRQLCAQVAEIIGAALATLDDPIVATLYVRDVMPAPDAGRLQVTLSGAVTSGPVPERLASLRGYLRSEVAAGITRKRVPELALVFAPEDELS